MDEQRIENLERRLAVLEGLMLELTAPRAAGGTSAPIVRPHPSRPLPPHARQSIVHPLSPLVLPAGPLHRCSRPNSGSVNDSCLPWVWSRSSSPQGTCFACLSTAAGSRP